MYTRQSQGLSDKVINSQGSKALYPLLSLLRDTARPAQQVHTQLQRSRPAILGLLATSHHRFSSDLVMFSKGPTKLSVDLKC